MKIGFNGKIVIVTGAGTGVGRTLSHEFARRGAVVYVTALTLGEARTVADEVVAMGGNAIPVKTDVSAWQDLQEVIELVVSERRQLDVIVNNAGFTYIGEFSDMDEALVEKMIRINLTGAAIGTLYAYRQIKRQGFGHILNISSIAGFYQSATMTIYSATKHGVLGFTNNLATEAKGVGVDVRAACLGFVRSDLIDKAAGNRQRANLFETFLPKPQSARDAAKKLIDNFAKGKSPVFTPGYAAFVWRLARLFLELLNKANQDTVKRYRESLNKNSQ